MKFCTAWKHERGCKANPPESILMEILAASDNIHLLSDMVRKRNIILHIATSADGFIARSDGSVDWLDRPSPKGNLGHGGVL